MSESVRQPVGESVQPVPQVRRIPSLEQQLGEKSAQLEAELGPASAVERLLVERLAVYELRLERLAELEEGLWMTAQAQGTADVMGTRLACLVSRRQRDTQTAHSAALHLLLCARAQRTGQPLPPPPAAGITADALLAVLAGKDRHRHR